MNATPLPAGSLRATSLNAARREKELARVAESAQLDLLVVGGGITGAGIALDAAARGLTVALVEAEDLARGASSWSHTVLDGGLGLPAQGSATRRRPGLARETAVERGILMTRTAPQLVRTLPRLVPLRSGISRRAEWLLGSGLHAEDILRRSAQTPSSVLPAPHRLPTAEAHALVPGLNTDDLRGALLGFDGQLVDDARLVIALARTAAGFGARVLTRVRVRKLERDGADVVDQRSGETLRLRARAVVNATGVWASELDPEVHLRHSHVSRLVVDADAVGIAGTAVNAPIPGQPGRSLLLVPRPEGHAYLGFTEESVDESSRLAGESLSELSLDAVPQSDVDSLFNAASVALGQTIDRSAFVGAFTSPRPRWETPRRLRERIGVSRKSSNAPASADLPRRQALFVSPNGIVTVLGGKLTAYRKLATEAVDTAVRTAGLPTGPSRTASVPLVGAAARTHLARLGADAHLISKYGTEAVRLEALMDLDPDLAEPVAPGLQVTAAEVLWAVRHEGALAVDDVLHRRTHLRFDPRGRERARPAVATLVDRALRGVSL